MDFTAGEVSTCLLASDGHVWGSLGKTSMATSFGFERRVSGDGL